MFAVTVPMAMVTISTDVGTIIAWRFVQGLLLPPIFTVVLAYIGDEWPPAEVAGVAGLYVSGSSLGSICGPFIPACSPISPVGVSHCSRSRGGGSAAPSWWP